MVGPFFLILFLHGVNIWAPQEDVFKFDTFADCRTASNVWLNARHPKPLSGEGEVMAICKDSNGMVVSTYIMGQ
jgi:hypothetical protein